MKSAVTRFVVAMSTITTVNGAYDHDDDDDIDRDSESVNLANGVAVHNSC